MGLAGEVVVDAHGFATQALTQLTDAEALQSVLGDQRQGGRLYRSPCRGVGLGGCASVDQLMGNISNTLDSTGDVLSGDFRAVATAIPVTLNQIWTEWKKNEVNASKKYLRTRLSIPGIVISVSRTSPSVIQSSSRSSSGTPPTGTAAGWPIPVTH